MAFFSQVLSFLHQVPIAVRIFTLIAAVPLALYAYDRIRREKLFPGYPLIALDGKTPEDSWINYPKETLVKGAQECPDSPFQVLSNSGPKIIIPQRYADEVRSSPHVNFQKSFLADFPWKLPGFKAFALQQHDPTVLPTVVRTKLTSTLASLIQPLITECLLVIADQFGKQAEGEWKTINIEPNMQQMIARFTLRMMLGEEMAHNPELVEIHVQHARHIFAAGSEVRAYPTVLWPIVHWFLPGCRALRQQLRRGCDLIEDEVRRREQEARATIAAGKKVAKHNDSVGWHVEVTKGRPYDLGAAQLAFSMAAIHNTSAQLAGAMWELCEHPEWIDILRKEAIDIIRELGWTRQALTKMDLQDAFHKETQSFVRGPLTTVRRYATDDIVFHDGFKIGKGRRLYLMPLIRTDKQDDFDPYRWIKKREASQTPAAHFFVASGMESQTFGLGKHACPGRWFAHDEIKIAVTILILKYDWRKAPSTPKPYFLAKEDVAVFPKGIELQMKARTPEVEIPSLV